MGQLELEVLRRFLRPRRVEGRGVLVDQVGVLGAAGAAKVLDLHDLGEDGLVELVLQGRRAVIAFVEVLLELRLASFTENASCDISSWLMESRSYR